MSALNFTIVEQKEDKTIWVLRQQSNDKTQAKDIPSLSKKFYGIVGKKDGEVIPFFVISKNYDRNSGDFTLLIGGTEENMELTTFIIPKGIYGKVTVKPKLGFMWGLSVGEAKRAFYTEWLPKSGYTSLNMEYEHHTEITMSKNPQIDILFAVKK